MAENPSALVRLIHEFLEAEPDARNSGIFARKAGYHNSRRNHQLGINGGSPSDYSIQTAADKRGPADSAAALDISFDSARLRSDFRIIAKYSDRIYVAMKNRDPRLFYKGEMVWREFFGNIDLDRTVEGWSLYRGRAASSDSSHVWHIHMSEFRKFVENWDATKGMLDILLGRNAEPEPEPIPEDDMPTMKEFMDYDVDITPGEQEKYGYPPKLKVRSLLVHAGGASYDVERAQQLEDGIEDKRYEALLANMKATQEMVKELTAKVDALAETPTPDPQRTYTVVAGDTLSGIAARFDTTVEELASLNNISDPSKLSVGQVLVLP